MPTTDDGPGPTDDRGAVVVTGAHRSGTTLLGDIVSRASSTWTVWEPFNRHWGLRDVHIAYPYLGAGDVDAPPMSSLTGYLATGRARWSVKRGRGARPLPAVRETVSAGRRYVRWYRQGAGTPVVKDPFVLLALAALQPAVTRRPVLVSVRHPCSWVASLRRMSWPAGHELNALIAQDQLYDEHLSTMLARKDWTREDDLAAGATAWACLYHMLDVQLRDGADALVVPLESFGREPVETLRAVYGRLALPAPPDLDQVAAHYAGADATVTPEAGTKHLLQRDSRALNEAWKHKLTAAEIDRVRAITEDVFGTYYLDWQTAESRLPA